jgi:hypothetical protein
MAGEHNNNKIMDAERNKLVQPVDSDFFASSEKEE